MRPIKAAVLVFFLLCTLGLSSQEGLYVLDDRGEELFLFDKTGQVRQWELPLKIDQLFATPGGAYLFLVSRTGRILGLNVVSGELDRDQTLALDNLRWITFSPTGHELIVQGQNKSLRFDHARGLLSNAEEIPLRGNERISFNRRGTRYYQSQEGSLKYRLYQDHSPIKEVPRTGDVEQWIVGPRFRTLWGFDERGRLQIVDEPRARNLKSLRQSYLPGSLQFRDSSAFLLQADGRTVESLDLRRFRTRESINLDGQASDLILGEGDWYLLFEGRIALYEEDFSGTPRWIPLDFTPGDALWLTLHQGEGFACF